MICGIQYLSYKDAQTFIHHSLFGDWDLHGDSEAAA